MAVTNLGPVDWGASRDQEGHRTYTIVFRVKTDSTSDGPGQVLRCPGLPYPGTTWLWGNDRDDWAYLLPDTKVRRDQAREGEKHYFWLVEMTYSTKLSTGRAQRCQDIEVADPLLEPPKITGGFDNYQEEGLVDRFGNPIKNSAWEQIRGQQNEWDAGRPKVRIEFTSLLLGGPLFCQAMHCLNDRPMWGFPDRSVKLSMWDWEKAYHGRCFVYFRHTLEFDIRYAIEFEPEANDFVLRGGWDRDMLDEGNKCLQGHWDTATGAFVTDDIGGAAPDPFNPNHFMRFVDRQGNPGRVILNGAGLPAEVNIAGRQKLASVTVINKGAGYKIGDIIAFAGGTKRQGTFVAVTEVENALGQIRSVGIRVAGDYSVVPPNNVTQDKTDGVGTGATFAAVWETIGGYESVIGHIHVEKYHEFNHFLLGVPIALEA